MSSKLREVDPNLIWQKEEETKNVGTSNPFKPWTTPREIPGFDYKTSQKVGLPYVFQYNKFIEAPDIANLREVEGYNGYEEVTSHYKTISRSSFGLKFAKTEPGEHGSYINNFDALKNLLKTKDLKMESNLTEYKDTYKRHSFDPNIFGEYKDHTNEIFLKLPNTSQEILSIGVDNGGALKERDIYRSQTHFIHHYISPEKVREANESLGGESAVRVFSNPHPIDPELRLPFRQVSFRKKTNPVPHSGMLSESKEKYKRQVDFFAPSDTVKKVETYVFEPSPVEDMITEVNKNHTYYNHIGHNWRTVFT